VSGRTAHFINAFGEEVIVTNAEEAITNACAKHNCSVRDFHAAPIFMENKEGGAHQWLVEFEVEPTDLNAFRQTLDKALQEVNSDYAAKRAGNIVLRQLDLIQAEKGLFHHWLKSKGKLGGQNKIPRLSNERKLLTVFLELNESLRNAQ
jgi:hypothetical protein